MITNLLRDEVRESPLTKKIAIPEEIAEQKIVVYKPRIDIEAVRVTAEEMKTGLFRKFVFMKPKPEEVEVVSINKYFEPFVVVDGRRHCGRWLVPRGALCQPAPGSRAVAFRGGHRHPGGFSDQLVPVGGGSVADGSRHPGVAGDPHSAREHLLLSSHCWTRSLSVFLWRPMNVLSGKYSD